MRPVFELLDEDENVVLDLTNQVPRIVGQLNMPASASGVIAVPEFATSSPWFYISQEFAANTRVLQATASGSGTGASFTITWNGGAGGGILVYGVY